MKLWQRLQGCVSGIDSPGQLAAGLTFGMMIGFIPKDSLIVYSLLGVLLVIRANLIAASIAGLVSAGLAGLLTPVFHTVGLYLLESNTLKPLWQQISELPLVGWTRFNNSLVMGSFVIGLFSAVPVFHVSKRWFAAYGSASYRRFRNSSLICMVVGVSKQVTSTQTVFPEVETAAVYQPTTRQPKLREG